MQWYFWRFLAEGTIFWEWSVGSDIMKNLSARGFGHSTSVLAEYFDSEGVVSAVWAFTF